MSATSVSSSVPKGQSSDLEEKGRVLHAFDSLPQPEVKQLLLDMATKYQDKKRGHQSSDLLTEEQVQCIWEAFSERPTLGLSRAELIAFYMCFVAALIKTGHPYESHFADEAHHDYLFQFFDMSRAKEFITREDFGVRIHVLYSSDPLPEYSWKSVCDKMAAIFYHVGDPLLRDAHGQPYIIPPPATLKLEPLTEIECRTAWREHYIYEDNFMTAELLTQMMKAVIMRAAEYCRQDWERHGFENTHCDVDYFHVHTVDKFVLKMDHFFQAMGIGSLSEAESNPIELDTFLNRIHKLYGGSLLPLPPFLATSRPCHNPYPWPPVYRRNNPELATQKECAFAPLLEFPPSPAAADQALEGGSSSGGVLLDREPTDTPRSATSTPFPKFHLRLPTSLATSGGSSPPRMNLLLLGDAGVGKTSLLRKLSGLPVNASIDGGRSSSRTHRVERCELFAELENGSTVQVVVFDTPGVQRISDIPRNLFRNVHGIIVMHDVTDRKSFVHVRSWLHSALEVIRREDGLSKVATLLLAGKHDLVSSQAYTAEELAQLQKDSGSQVHGFSCQASMAEVHSILGRIVLRVLRIGNGSVPKTRRSHAPVNEGSVMLDSTFEEEAVGGGGSSDSVPKKGGCC